MSRAESSSAEMRRDREEAAAAAGLEKEGPEVGRLEPEPERAQDRPRVEPVQHQGPGFRDPRQERPSGIRAILKSSGQ